MDMGSEGVVNQREAAEILGVSCPTVAYYTRKGVLRPKMVDGQTYGGQVLYDVEEIAALKEARERKQTLTEVAETASQAWAAARVAQRKVETLERLLGLKLPNIPRDNDSIKALHIEAEEDLKRIINGAERINYWSDRFFAICEEYLHRVEEVTGDEEAWQVYLNLSTNLIKYEDFRSSEYDPCERLAYRRLHTARERLRRAIFIYMLQKYGKRKAFSMFSSEFYGPHHDVMMHATEEW